MTLAEIARLAGVSRTTASYVLNGQGPARRIKSATIDRVMAVARDNDFQIDAQAAALRGGASRTLGFILPDLENASYARLAKLLEQGARARGYQLLIAGSGDDPRTERELASAFRARRCDALIVASALASDDGFYRRLQHEGMPVIAVDRAQSPGAINCVLSDNRKGAAALTRSVLAPAAGSVVWLDALQELAMTRERREGFEAVARSRSGQWAVFSGPSYDRACGAALMARVLAEQGLPDALITASYTLMEGVLDVLLEQPNGLPESLRMATFGDDRLLDFLPVRVHSLPQKHQIIAEATLDRAMSAIAGDREATTVVINRSLKRRR